MLSKIPIPRPPKQTYIVGCSAIVFMIVVYISSTHKPLDYIELSTSSHIESKEDTKTSVASETNKQTALVEAKTEDSSGALGGIQSIQSNGGQSDTQSSRVDSKGDTQLKEPVSDFKSKDPSDIQSSVPEGESGTQSNQVKGDTQSSVPEGQSYLQSSVSDNATSEKQQNAEVQEKPSSDGNENVENVPVNQSTSITEESKSNTNIDSQDITIGKPELKNITIPKANIVMIICDDMRPEIGAMKGDDLPWLYPDMHTPNLDKLASKSLLFRHAFCQQPLCNPSRVSLLTSRRPDSTGITTNFQQFRHYAPNVYTVGQYFKERGYTTLAMGKIFHPLGTCDSDRSWSEPCYLPSKAMESDDAGWSAYTKKELQGKKLMDQQTLEEFHKHVKNLAKGARENKNPFFIALGIKKPHVPLDFPEEFISHYPANVSIPPPENLHLPVNIPDVAWTHKHKREQTRPNFDKRFTSLHGMSNNILRNLTRAYYATVSYVDSIVGEAIGYLESEGLDNNTIVVFMSDHAVHLGENGIFGKKTNFLINAHVPLIIRVPGVTDKGIVTNNLVELTDLFPTLAELTGFPSLEICPDKDSKLTPLCTEGTSMVPLLRNPHESKWKERVFYQYPNDMKIRDQKTCMGYSVHDAKHRYTEWLLSDSKGVVTWDPVCGKEFYDLTIDPRETVNRANDTSYSEVMDKLHKQLQQGWRAAIPQ